jgi:hypothetical protein
MKKYAGIDIGKSGAIVKLVDNSAITSIKMPLIKKELNLFELNQVFENLKDDNYHVVFEKLGVIFGSSKVTAFSMGEQSGIIEALCVSHEIPYTKVRAVDWQKEMFQGITKIQKAGKTSTDTKAMALIAVNRLFPNVPLTFSGATKPHDGLIDALLMAEYARRKNL